MRYVIIGGKRINNMGEGTTRIEVKNDKGELVTMGIDNQLKEALDVAKARVKKDWDYVAVIAGLSGAGKSTFTRNTLAKYCCPWFSDKYTAMTDKQFIHITKYCKPKSAVILDESFASMNTKLIFSPEYLRIINHLQIIRQKNLYIFLCLPNYFDLGKNMAIFRSSHLFVTYAQESGERGYFLAFGREQKRILYVKGMKYMDYYAQDPNFKGRFYKNAAVNSEETYIQMKLDNLQEKDRKIKKVAAKDYSIHRAILKLQVEKGLSLREIGKLFEMSHVTAGLMIKDYKKFMKPD